MVRIPDEQDFKETPINRTKWLMERRNLQEGDIVVIKEDNMPPNKWKLGRIEQLLPGEDNLVRTVILRTSSGIYKRPITKLGLLVAN